jgi:uncharacterized delta-60 repeat protein
MKKNDMINLLRVVRSSFSRRLLPAVAVFLWLNGPNSVVRAAVDSSFNCVLGGESGDVRVLVKQPDGKLLVGGDFTSVKGIPRYGIARVLPDGSVDLGFDAGIISGGINRRVYALALQTNGQIVIGGDFQTINGTARYGIARLNSDGGLDPGFNPGAGVTSSSKPGTVLAVVVQPDGAILLSGGFDKVNGVSRSRIARLLAGGTLDTNFNPGAGITGGNGRVNALALQTDGKILAGGSFTRVDNLNRKNLARLNADGTLDPTFDPLDQLWSELLSILAGTDGKIVVTGYNYCRRLMPDGKSLDPAFIEPDTGIGADASELHTIARRPGGGYALGGKFYRVGNRYRLVAVACATNTYVAVGDAVFHGDDTYPTRADLLKFTNQGSLRSSPLTGVAFGNGTAVEVGRSQEILTSTDLKKWTGRQTDVPQGFNCVTFVNDSFLALGPDGAIRLSTDGGTNWQSPTYSPSNADLHAAAGNGNTWVAVGGTAGNGVVLFSNNGSAWTGVSGIGTNILHGVAYGKGTFVAVGENGATWASTNGQNWLRGTNTYTNTLYAVAFGNNTFVAVGGEGRILNSASGTSWTNVVNYSAQTLQPLLGITFANGKFLTVGACGTVLVSDPSLAPPSFYFMDRTLADQSMNGVALLEENGVLLTNFVSGIKDLLSNYPEVVNSLVAETNGVFVAGNFVQINLTNSGNITWTNAGDLAFLKADGTLNTSFNIGMGAGGATPAYAMAVQPDGKIVLGGDFTSVNGVSRNRIARVNADGSVDTTFDPGPGADRAVYSVALHPNGNIVIGGFFNSVNNRSRRPVARLNPDGSVDTSFDPGIGLAFNNTIRALAVQPDEKVLLGGSSAGILRLNASGTTDASFTNNLGTGLKGGSVSSIALQPDGKIILGGTFTNFNGRTANRLARLLPSGTNDDAFSFSVGLGADGAVNAAVLQRTGQASTWSILLGGAFTNFNGTAATRVARLNQDGTLDPAFTPGAGPDAAVTLLAPYWDAISNSGVIYVGGSFTNFAGVNRLRLARLTANGALDSSFNIGGGVDDTLTALTALSGDRALVGGLFLVADNARWPNLAMFVSGGTTASPWNDWKAAQFTTAELANAAISGDDADPDADGIPNVVEFAFNLDPKVAARSGLPTAAVQMNTADGKDYLVLTYHRRRGNSGINFVVEVSNDLAQWLASASRLEEMGATPDAGGLTETVNVRVKPSVREVAGAFIRVRISKP